MPERRSERIGRLAAIGEGNRRVPFEYEALESEARNHLSAEAYQYTTAGAGSGSSVTENRRALDRYRLTPRVLRGTDPPDLSTVLLGRDLAAPVGLAPIGLQSMYHESAEDASSRAAASIDIPFCLSTAGSRSIETVAGSADSGCQFFQLYWHPDRQVTKSYAERAEAAGYDAIVVTVDFNGPRWMPDVLGQESPVIKGVPHQVPLTDPAIEAKAEAAGMTVAEYVTEHELSIADDLDWTDIDWLADQVSLPILVKGIRHPTDAKLAVEHTDGIVVSNHGGRQVDGEVGAAAALPEIVDVVDGRILVLFDSGIRTGADVAKAVALGADLVFVGRPYVYGLAIAGEAGVREVIEHLLAEFASILPQCGCESPAEITRDHLTWPENGFS